MEGKTKDISERILTVWHAIEEDLGGAAPQINPDSLPEGELVEELPDPLLDTKRSYLEQIRVYKEFKAEFR